MLEDGCDAISIFSLSDGAVHRGATHVSPGRLSSTPSLRTILAPQANSIDPFVYVLRKGRASWTAGTLEGANISAFSAAHIDSSGESFVVTVGQWLRHRQRNAAPYFLSRFRMPVVVREGAPLGPPLVRSPTDGVMFAFLPARTDGLFHAASDQSRLHTVDSSTLVDALPPIPFQELAAPPDVRPLHPTAVNFMHAAMGPDGRYIVTNRGAIPQLNVIDLWDRRVWTVDLRPEAEFAGGVAFNWSTSSTGLLAVHERRAVSVYRFQAHALSLVSTVVIPDGLNTVNPGGTGPHLAVAWSGKGTHLIAASRDGTGEFAVIGVAPDARDLTIVDTLRVCPVSEDYPNDILTTNGLGPIPTPAPPTVTSTATIETPTATQTPTADSTETPTRTPSATSLPTPLHLPIALNEDACTRTRRAAVGLVIDTSSSMLERTRRGRTKLEAAVAAAGSFVDLLSFPEDQAAIVGFDSDVVASELSSSAPELRAALAALESERGTDIAAAVEAAHAELMSGRRKPENFPAMIVLTDGRANDGPLPGIAAADSAKADGIAVMTVGLGSVIDRDQLLQMATRPEWFYETTNAEDLVGVYEAIAVDLPCPTDRYWGRR